MPSFKKANKVNVFSSPKSVVTVWYILFCIRFAMAIDNLVAISYKLFKVEKKSGLIIHKQNSVVIMY